MSKKKKRYTQEQQQQEQRSERSFNQYIKERKTVNLIPKSLNQEHYIDLLTNQTKNIVFATGPAGTGKTFLAMLAGIKAYKEHQKKLEAARIKRENARKSKFIEKVQESIGEFEREAFLVEDNVNMLKDIVRTKSIKTLKFSDGKMKVDLFTASALVTVMDKVNADNRTKLTKMVNGKKAQFQAAANATFKMLNKAR